ncbi:alpha/beta fold hydrolase [Maribacter stanieri]|uniref:Pimeloyl-ACP methyl ester carboxylesterase n=1 Tax=Maribacter stanieri TaxID=440514 RepID=A0A1I6J9A4_9FLAO|nr:alpha/beta hydrolase [Maribacter stanieri]SFR75557.1 Pimeloyl-ACP methyl ester carboxylesterase [Maribacter stanieri]
MKVYGISGLGADKRVFKHLSLDFEFLPIDWITPKNDESIKHYSERLSKVIDTKNDFCLIGVSFGGLIATEISQILNPKKVILISSAHTKNELRPIYKWFGKVKIIKLIPAFLLNPPRILAKYIMGAKNNLILNEILDDTDASFVKWALYELTRWQNSKQSNTVLKINGTIDKLIPPRGTTRMKLIQNGGHFMIVDRADEISKIINNELHNSLA